LRAFGYRFRNAEIGAQVVVGNVVEFLVQRRSRTQGAEACQVLEADGAALPKAMRDVPHRLAHAGNYQHEGYEGQPCAATLTKAAAPKLVPPEPRDEGQQRQGRPVVVLKKLALHGD